MSSFDDLIPIDWTLAKLQEKEKKMTDKVMNFRMEYSEFETYDEALKSAQKAANKYQEDKIIWSKYSTVKYPISNYEVEMAPAVTPAAV